MIVGGAISRSSKRQPTIALSTIKAEYMANTQATKEAIWIQNWWWIQDTWRRRKWWWFDVTIKVRYHWQRTPLTMHEQNTLMYNIILFENELKMKKFDLNIVQQNTWWRMSLSRHYQKNDIISW
jgi:hypothetical protein